MPDLHSLPTGWYPQNAVRNNGPDNLALERYKLRELAEGFPCYRDTCEWENFASIFHPQAFIYTTWSGRVPVDTFIRASKAGMDAGAWIMHRVHGTTTDINLDATRAVTKMKANITQRFTLPAMHSASPSADSSSSASDGVEVDAESDCRFIFFWVRMPAGDPHAGEWRASYVRHWYEKDKLIPINPARVPTLDEARLRTYPVGYRHLAYCQELTMGVKVLGGLPGHRREGDTECGRGHDLLYDQARRWVEGEEFEV